MPVFNTEEYLQESIDSILNQSYGNFEFLIGDDGSTDNSYQILLSQNDPRIKIFRSEKNVGYASVLNNLINASEGEFIARQDSDDISLPNRFKKQIEFLNKNPDTGLCGTNVNFFGNKVKRLLRPIQNEEIKAFMLFNNPITHPTVMFRRSVLLACENGKYNQELVPAEDYAMWFDFSRKTKLANLPENLFKYRWHANNISVVENVNQTTKINLIRKNIVWQTLSYEIKEEETLLINSIFNTNLYTIGELYAFESLLLKLIQKNKATHYYNDQVLQNHFFHIWMSVCFKTVQISSKQKVSLFLASDLFNISGLLNYMSWRNISSSVYNRLH